MTLNAFQIIMGFFVALLPIAIAIFLLSFVYRTVQAIEDIADAQIETNRYITAFVKHHLDKEGVLLDVTPQEKES